MRMTSQYRRRAAGFPQSTALQRRHGDPKAKTQCKYWHEILKMSSTGIFCRAMLSGFAWSVGRIAAAYRQGVSEIS